MPRRYLWTWTWGTDFFFKICARPKLQHFHFVHLQENKQTEKVVKRGTLLVLDCVHTLTTFSISSPPHQLCSQCCPARWLYTALSSLSWLLSEETWTDDCWMTYEIPGPGPGPADPSGIITQWIIHIQQHLCGISWDTLRLTEITDELIVPFCLNVTEVMFEKITHSVTSPQPEGGDWDSWISLLLLWRAPTAILL